MAPWPRRTSPAPAALAFALALAGCGPAASGAAAARAEATLVARARVGTVAVGRPASGLLPLSPGLRERISAAAEGRTSTRRFRLRLEGATRPLSPAAALRVALRAGAAGKSIPLGTVAFPAAPGPGPFDFLLDFKRFLQAAPAPGGEDRLGFEVTLDSPRADDRIEVGDLTLSWDEPAPGSAP